MKSLIKNIQYILIVLFLGNLFLMFMALGSGHQIPLKTNLTFLGVLLVLVFVYIFLAILNRRMHDNK